jgi:hypothetical protein
MHRLSPLLRALLYFGACLKSTVERSLLHRTAVIGALKAANSTFY